MLNESVIVQSVVVQSVIDENVLSQSVIDQSVVDQDVLLRRSVIEKYSSKSIDDKRLISIKFYLIDWSISWLFDALQLTSIVIYLYSTTYEMNCIDVEFDLFMSRSHVVK